MSNAKFEVYNGEEYTVCSWDEESCNLIQKDTRENIKIPFDQITKLFHPGNAYTVWKSQGKTFDKPYTIWQWNEYDEKCKYVAISRSK